jgi:hypothetical protein
MSALIDTPKYPVNSTGYENVPSPASKDVARQLSDVRQALEAIDWRTEAEVQEMLPFARTVVLQLESLLDKIYKQCDRI